MSTPLYLLSHGRNVFARLAEEMGTERQTVAVITTAALVEPDHAWLARDLEALRSCMPWEILEYDIAGKTRADLEKDLRRMDILYVAGGNVLYLLQEMQKSGFLSFAREHVAAGKRYIGQSAGAIVAAPDIAPAFRSDKAKEAPDLNGYEGLGLVDFLVLPHWGSRSLHEMYFTERLERAYTEDCTPIPFNDHQYLRVEDGAIRIVDVRVPATLSV